MCPNEFWLMFSNDGRCYCHIWADVIALNLLFDWQMLSQLTMDCIVDNVLFNG